MDANHKSANPSTALTFTIEPNTLYSLDALRDLLGGIVEPRTFLERLHLREHRIFRDAVFGFELIRSARRATSYGQKPEAAPPALPFPLPQPGAADAKNHRRLTAADLRRS